MELQDHEFQHQLKTIQVTEREARMLFRLLDHENTGKVDLDKIIANTVRLHQSAKFIDIMKLMYVVEQQQQMFQELNEEVLLVLRSVDKSVGVANFAPVAPQWIALQQDFCTTSTNYGILSASVAPASVGFSSEFPSAVRGLDGRSSLKLMEADGPPSPKAISPHASLGQMQSSSAQVVNTASQSGSAEPDGTVESKTNNTFKPVVSDEFQREAKSTLTVKRKRLKSRKNKSAEERPDFFWQDANDSENEFVP